MTAIPWTPRNYQKAGVKFLVGHSCAGLWWEPGMAKTSTILAAFEVLRSKGLASRMLVICPLRPAYSVWGPETQKWRDFQHLRVAVLHGPKKQAALASKADIDVINPEGLSWLLSQQLRRHGSDPWPWDILVIDEAHTFRHADTLRFKKLKPYLPEFRRRYTLTGSPTPRSLLDLFGQVFLLDLGGALGRYITHYRNAYFNPSGYGGFTWTPRQGAEDAIYAKLKPLIMRLAAKDYLDLPPLIHNRVHVDLPAKALRAYKQMEEQMIAMVNDDLVVAANAAVASGKCRQITGGGIYAADGKAWQDIHEAKVDAVEEIVEELQGKPALVAYEFAHELARLQKRFPDAPYLGGGVSAKRFKEIEAAWNRGEVPVLLAQPQSAALGINLQQTEAAVIFHSTPWALDMHDQFIGRVWRQGQKHRVVCHYIVAKDTVDEVVMQALARKSRTQNDLLDALKTYVRGVKT